MTLSICFKSTIEVFHRTQIRAVSCPQNLNTGSFISLTSLVCPLSRSDVTVVCRDMEFSRYPLDTHVCQFKLSSCK